MRRDRTCGVVAAVVLAAAMFAGPPTAAAKEVAEKAPAPGLSGKAVHEWKTKDGLVYRYRMPLEAIDGPLTLTLILHGSNLDRQWGFANHAAKSFRPHDLVVSPDGTTPNGRGGFNLLGELKDAKRMHALIEELRAIFEIDRVYLYGHSQGSFFATFYAGLHPEDVDGIVAHASGVWTWTKQGRHGHHQAICFMHGTQDPAVPYDQSVGGYKSTCDAKYPLVRLRSLEGWNHWPAEHNGPVPHTSQQLAWCECMTATHPERLEAAWAVLADPVSKPTHDYAATWRAAQRLKDLEAAPPKLRAAAAEAAAAVEALAAKHVEALDDVPSKPELDDEAWIGHLPVFLRAFAGVPAAEAFGDAHEKLLDKQRKEALKELRKYWKDRGKKPDRAFDAGVAALEAGYLTYFCWDSAFLGNLDGWAQDAKKLGIGKKTAARYRQARKALDKARKEGWRAFEKINNKADL